MDPVKAVVILLLPLTLLAAAVTPGFSQDLTLEEAVQAALQHDGQVKIKKLDLAMAGYGIREARAARLPVIDLSASVSVMTNPPEGITIAKGEFGFSPTPTSQVPLAIPDQDYILIEDPEHTYFSLSTSLKQPLYTWGKIKAGIDLAFLEREISALQLDRAEKEVRRDTRLAFFAVVIAVESMQLLEEASATLQQVLKDRQNAYYEGVMNLQDVLEAEANLARVKAEKVRAEFGYTSAVEALQLLTGLEVREKSLVPPPGVPLPVLNLGAVRDKVIRESAELEVLYHRIRQAESGIQALEGGGPFRPDIGLDITLDISGGKVPFFGANWTDSWDVNLIVSLGTNMSLFDGGSAKAQTAKARIQSLQAREGYKQLLESLDFQIQKSIETVTYAYYGIQEKQAKARFAAERYRNAQVSFANELITREEEMGARIASIQAELELLSARFEYESARTALEYLAGDL